MSKPTERRSFSNLKPRKLPKHKIQIKGQIIPISKNSAHVQNQTIAKIRSSSMTQSRTITRCASNIHFYMKQKRPPTSSFSQLPTSSSGVYGASTDTSRVSKHNQSEEKIRKILKELPVDAPKRCTVIENAFQVLIKSEKTEKNALVLVKDAIKDCFEFIQRKHSKEVEGLNMQLFALNKTTEQLRTDTKTMHKQIDKLAKENYDLSKTIDEKESNFNEIKKRILQISQVNVDAIPKNLETWQYIVLENKSYFDLCSNLKQEICDFQLKEEKLLQLIGILKKKGYPVEEIYCNEVQKSEDVGQSDTESELLVSTELRNPIIPPGIPPIDVTKIEPESCSSYSSNSSYEIP